MTKTQELVTAQSVHAAKARAPMAIIPHNMDEVARMAKDVYDSRLAPRDLNSPQAVYVSICHGLEVGLPPMAAIQSIAVINGRPCMWGDALLGIVFASGLLEDMDETLDEETMTATCRMTRIGMKTPIVRTFSQADAELAKLWGNEKKDPWIKYPKRMLQMRARSWAIRDRFPDVTKGLIVREEAMDIPPPTREELQEQQQSRMAQITQAAGGTDGAGFNTDHVDAEVEQALTASQSVSDGQTDDEGPNATEPETAPKSDDVVPSMLHLVKLLHQDLYLLKAKKGVDTKYINSWQELVSTMPEGDRDILESIYLKHLDRVDGTIEAQAVAAYVKDTINDLKETDNAGDNVDGGGTAEAARGSA